MCALCVATVLPTIPAALSAEYPACDSSYWAFQLLARSVSAKGEKSALPGTVGTRRQHSGAKESGNGVHYSGSSASCAPFKLVYDTVLLMRLHYNGTIQMHFQMAVGSLQLQLA